MGVAVSARPGLPVHRLVGWWGQNLDHAQYLFVGQHILRWNFK